MRSAHWFLLMIFRSMVGYGGVFSCFNFASASAARHWSAGPHGNAVMEPCQSRRWLGNIMFYCMMNTATNARQVTVFWALKDIHYFFDLLPRRYGWSQMWSLAEPDMFEQNDLLTLDIDISTVRLDASDRRPEDDWEISPCCQENLIRQESWICLFLWKEFIIQYVPLPASLLWDAWSIEECLSSLWRRYLWGVRDD